ncbi:MAG: IS110 family transposase [Arcobacter sp.]|nr:IS110 family transposase [Arcobacter sp.]
MYFVGIDIAKAFSVCSVIDDKEEMIIKPFPFNSSVGGFKKLINNIVSLNCDTKDIVIGMEATGLLFENLYRYLIELNYNVILLNPYQTAQYRNMVTMKYVKNDNIDSLIISLLIKSGRYSKGYVNEEQLQSLKVLFRHKENIKDKLKSLKRETSSLLAVVFPELEKVIKDPYNVSGLILLDKYPTAKHFDYVTVERILKLFRKTKGNNFNEAKAELLLSYAKDTIYSGVAKDARAFFIRSNITLIRALQEQIKSLEDEMLRIFDKPINSNEVTKEDEDYISSVLDNLRTIPGVSDKTLLALLAECGNLDRFKNAKALIGYLGLYPTQEQSGNTLKYGRLAKRGAKYAKKALYLASVAAVRHNSELKQIFRNQLTLGRAKKEALIIIARKLAYIIWAIYNHNKPYDPSRVFVAHP